MDRHFGAVYAGGSSYCGRLGTWVRSLAIGCIWGAYRQGPWLEQGQGTGAVLIIGWLSPCTVGTPIPRHL